MPQLLAPIRYRVVGDDNLPLVGGKIYTYSAGTTTPKDTYTTFGMGAANTNPIILDENGEAAIWLDGAYKIRITDEDDNILQEEDNVRDLTTSQTFTNSTLAGTLTVSASAVTWQATTTTHGGANHAFTGNLAVNGNTTLGNASSDTLTVNPNAISYPNNPTHANDHTYSGTLTTSLVAPAFTFGATFGNTSRAGANVLDHYLEASAQMSIVGSSTAGTASYGERTFNATRIGNRVFFDASLEWSSFTGTGNILITVTLPFTPTGVSSADYYPASIVADGLTHSNTLIAMVLANGTLVIKTESSGVWTDVPVDAAGAIYLTGSYRSA